MGVLRRAGPTLLLAGITILLLACGGFVAGDFPAALRGVRGSGPPGDLLITNVTHGKYDHWYGRFTSDDGSVVADGVGYAARMPDGTGVGDTFRARYPGGSDAYPERPGIGDWFGMIIEWLLALGGWAIFAVWVGWGWKQLLGGRREPPGPRRVTCDCDVVDPAA